MEEGIFVQQIVLGPAMKPQRPIHQLCLNTIATGCLCTCKHPTEDCILHNTTYQWATMNYMEESKAKFENFCKLMEEIKEGWEGNNLQ